MITVDAIEAGDTGDPEVHTDTWIIPRIIRMPPN
jgi:hypothetical protein